MYWTAIRRRVIGNDSRVNPLREWTLQTNSGEMIVLPEKTVRFDYASGEPDGNYWPNNYQTWCANVQVQNDVVKEKPCTLPDGFKVYILCERGKNMFDSSF